MDIDKTYAQHDQYFWEFIRSSGYDQIYNDKQIAAIIDSMQKTRLNLITFEKSLPLETFVEIQLSILCTMVSFQSPHEGKYSVLKVLNLMRKRIEDSMPKPEWDTS